MSEYEVIGGHDVAEFRLSDDQITLFSSEEDPETGEELGEVGTMSRDELQSAADVLDRVLNEGEEEVEAPDMDDVAMRQHPLLGNIVFLGKDDDGEIDEDVGAVFSPDEIIEAAEGL